jgi:hypothetical protein
LLTVRRLDYAQMMGVLWGALYKCLDEEVMGVDVFTFSFWFLLYGGFADTLPLSGCHSQKSNRKRKTLW